MAREAPLWPGLADGISEDERAAIQYLRAFVREKPLVAEGLSKFPWMMDGLTPGESRAMESIAEIYEKDPRVVEHLSKLPWFSGGVSEDHAYAIEFVNYLMDIDPGLAYSALDVAGGVEEKIAIELYVSLIRLFFTNRNYLEQIVGKEWFRDGLTDEEVALRSVLRWLHLNGKLLQNLIDDAHIVSESFTLPLAGKTNVFFISRLPFEEEESVMLRAAREGIEAIEQVIGEAWPQPNVVILIDPDFSTASNSYSYVNLIGFGMGILYHELGHYYFTGGLNWLIEGGAEFFESYALDRTREIDLDQSLRWLDEGIESCRELGVANIQDWLDIVNRGGARESPGFVCDYPIGEAFLWGMYDLLGQDATAAAIRQLYRTRAVGNGQHLTASDIYDAFLSNTPPGKEDAVREVYSKFHGGPVPPDR